MSALVTDCPRCGAKKITFDVSASNLVDKRHGWQRWFEAFSVCRHCGQGTIFILSESATHYAGVINQGVANLTPSVNDYMAVEGFVHIGNIGAIAPPEHVPPAIAAIFKEGATAFAVGIYNAAGTMFRLCVDLATRPKLPEGEVPELNAKTRRDLGLRLPWLFDNKILADDLRELSHCIKEDGNDGAHAGTLKKPDAEDLLDFTVALLERMYTEPRRLVLADERRKARREPPKNV